MKHSRLVWTALALWTAAGSTTLAWACDGKDGTKASGASACASTSAAAVTASNDGSMHACPSSMAAHCSAAQAAACKSAHMSCPSGAAGASAMAAGMAGAAAAGSAHAECKGEGLVKFAESSNHADCDGCVDMARCEQEIAAAGGRVQVVPLKNGVMYVYTAVSAGGVRTVQTAVMHRSERMMAWATAGDHVHLCNACKTMRGAVASGRLSREVVNIDGGCLTLMTSNDPTIVAKLHEMAAGTSRAKI